MGSSCQKAIPAWGNNLAEAKRNAEQLFGAFAQRFNNVQRDAKFTRARPLLGSYALVPGRLYRDTSLWTIQNSSDSSQGLYLEAGFDGTRYFFASRDVAPYPRRPGDERHYMRLRKIAPNQYEWITIVDHAVGKLTAPRAGAALGSFLTAFENRPSADLRADIRASFARTARVAGHLFALDTLTTSTAGDGSTSLALALRWIPDSIRAASPAFAAYVDKYIMPTTYRLTITDRAGRTYMRAVGTPGALSIRVRAHKGRLVALDGLPLAIPDSLSVAIDASAKLKIFRVGFSNLVGELTVEREQHVASLFFRFRKEPEWHFPLAIDHLIKTPLRAPFAGRGAEMRLSTRDDLGAQTMSVRHIRFVVHESAIMRWLGALGATAFGDFEGRAETEENRFLHSLFDALQKDVVALTP